LEVKRYGIEKSIANFMNQLSWTLDATIVLKYTSQGRALLLMVSLLKILSFATSHYATGMQLVVVCNYLGHVCNYKFGIV
jgi:hypothetical protein